MKQPNIDALIEKFYDGKTSIEEEDFLKQFLLANEDTKYEDVRLHFEMMNVMSNSNDELSDGFEDNLLKKLKKTSANGKRIKLIRTFFGIAASVAILISVWITVSIAGSKQLYGTINDPVLAFAETKKIIQEVSRNVKKGVSPVTTNLKKVEKGIEKTKNVKKVDEAINNVKQIKKLDETSALLRSMTKVKVKAGNS